jgi:hypothetical protein
MLSSDLGDVVPGSEPQSRQARHPDRGGAAVEFAIVLFPFMLLVLGGLDYGFFFFSDQVVTNAAREGARAGTLVDPAPAGAQSVAMGRATAVALSYMNNNGVFCEAGPGNAECITVTFPRVPPPAGDPAVSVVISYPAKSLTGFTAVILPKRVYAHAVMRWQ